MLWQASVLPIQLGTFLHAHDHISLLRPTNRNGYILPNLTFAHDTIGEQGLGSDGPAAFGEYGQQETLGEGLCEDRISR